MATVLAVFTGGATLVAYFIAMGMVAGQLLIGGIQAGYRSYRQGKGWANGFSNYINGNWACSVAVASALFLITLGIGKAVAAHKNAGAKQPPPDTPEPQPLKQLAADIKESGPIIDSRTGEEVGRFIVDPKGNVMIEPKGGSTVAAGKNGVDTHTLYPNGSNYQRLNPTGHASNPTPHGHGHLMGTGPKMAGQGASIDIFGNVVDWNSSAAHWTIK